MKKRFAFLLAVMFVMSVIFTGCEKKDDNNVRLGTAGVGGNYYNYGLHLAEALSADSDYTMTVKTTEGSAANMRLLSQGYIDMALVQMDILNDAANGTGDFDEALTGFHVVTGLYDECIQLVVRADSDINSVEDLKDKTVSLGEENSGAHSNAMDVLKMAGISTDMFTAKYLSYADAAEALEKNEIDAFFCTASVPTTAVVTLTGTTKVKLIDITGTVADALCQSDSAYKISTIPAGTYEGQDTAVTTIGVPAVLVAADTVTSGAEAAVLNVINSKGDEIQNVSFGVQAEEQEEGTPVMSFDMYMTLALAVLVLYIGTMLRKKIKFLETFCIPAPVIGGLLFAILSCILYVTGIVEFSFDETLKNVCMIMFFTSVGFQANLKVIKEGGVSLIIFLILVTALIFCQNGLAVGISNLLNISPFIGLCTGSIPMVGGHGTAGAFGAVLDDLGIEGATTLCTAAATFGLIMGSLMGGPLGRRLIEKHDLMKTVKPEDDTVLVEEDAKHRRSVSMYAPAAYQIAIAMGLGTIVSTILSKTGMTFPVYIGAMIVAAVMRNTSEFSGKFKVHMGEINDIGGICLSLFLGIAMVTLKLWQLASLALPLFILLAAQTIFMALFAYFVVYNVMGRNYDAAVLSAGTCGFGMGATPNAMANMQAITEKYAPSVQAYLLVPIVGSMFADFINSIVITFFINLL